MRGIGRSRFALALIVGGLLVAGIAPAAQASCPECYQPDFRIRLLGGALKGDNVYNTTAAGQTVNALAKPGKTRQIVLSIQNDGTQATAFTVTFTAFNGNFEHFTASYVVGWLAPQDITFTIQSTGYTTPTLAPGQVFYFRVYVHVLGTANLGLYTGATLSILPTIYPYLSDRVAWKVTAN